MAPSALAPELLQSGSVFLVARQQQSSLNQNSYVSIGTFDHTIISGVKSSARSSLPASDRLSTCVDSCAFTRSCLNRNSATVRSRPSGAGRMPRVRCGPLTEARLGGGGAGVLERPGLDQSGSSSSPQADAGGEMGKLGQRIRHSGGDKYRVLLLDHEKHTEQFVTKALPAVVPAVTSEDARRIFFESKELGAGIVLVTVKEHAEFYAQMMARRGLRSTIEPDASAL